MAHVQSTSENGYSATNTRGLSFTGVVAGNALLVATRVVTGAANEVTGVSSSVDGAFTKLTTESNGTIVLTTWYLENATAGSHTISYTTFGTGITVRWAIAEYDDVPAASIIDASTDGAFTTTTTPATANVTTTGTGRTIVSFVATNASATSIAPATGETERQEVEARLQFQDEAAATAGNYSASWTLGATQPGIYAILALKPGTIKYLKYLTAPGAASATGVEGWVFNVDGDSFIGKFTGKSFEASLESGEAVLKVAVADISPSGSTLSTSDTPLVVVRNTTYGTSMRSATVIEE